MKFIIMLVVVAFVTVKFINTGVSVGSNIVVNHSISTDRAIEEAIQ